MKEKERKNVKNPGMYRVNHRIELIVYVLTIAVCVQLCVHYVVFLLHWGSLLCFLHYYTNEILLQR